MYLNDMVVMFDIKPADCWPYVANDLKVMDKTLVSHNGMRMLII